MPYIGPILITRRAAHPRNARPRTPARAVRRGRRPGQPAGRVHRDQTPHPRSSGCPLPSVPATGSSRVAERRKRAHHSLHRPLARRPGWRLVPTCGNQEVEARRSADAQASSGSCCVKALHRSHLEAGDMTGASRPRAKSIPGALRSRDGGRKLGEENTALGCKERLGHHGAPRRQCAVPLRET